MGSLRCEIGTLIDFRFESGTMSVRRALGRVATRLAAAGVSADQISNIELVLAEVLNNIVEHAYVDSAGQIRIRAATDGVHLHILVEDQGREMPGGTPPTGILQPADLDNLPEGGFGWYLIRELCDSLQYARKDGWNQIRLSLKTGQLRAR